MGGVLRLSRRVVLWTVLLAAVAVIVAAVLVPRATGSTPYTVLTGSMEPTLSPGTLIVVRPIAPTEVAVGDVVTVQLESGKEATVTHRVQSVSYALSGDLSFVTKGDANTAADIDPRVPEQIRGELWYAIPYVGYVSQAATGQQRNLVVLGVGIALAVYAAWMFGSGWREGRDSRDAAAHTDEPILSATAAPTPATSESSQPADQSVESGTATSDRGSP